MKKKLTVGVIFGGRSGEHEVSLVSAASILKNLNKLKYDVIPIGITKQGRWLTQQSPLNLLKRGNIKSLKSLSLITPDTSQGGLVRIRHSAKLPGLKKIDVILPILHGTYGEDGAIQGLFELANIPYVGAGILGSALGMDKISQKYIFRQYQLPIVKFVNFNYSEYRTNAAKVLNLISKIKFPVFVKPSNLGSSVGINKALNKKQLISTIREAGQYDERIIVEQGIVSPREIEVAILGNETPRASVCGEIITSNSFYDYDAKYIDGKSRAVIPARLNHRTADRIKKIAIRAFQVLNCFGMARVDFLLDQKNTIYLSEVNTIPGFTSISMYPKLWEYSGLPYSELLDQLIKLALEKHRQKSKLLTSYQPKSKWFNN